MRYTVVLFSSLFMISYIQYIEKDTSYYTSTRGHIEWEMPVRERNRSSEHRARRSGTAAAKIPEMHCFNRTLGSMLWREPSRADRFSEVLQDIQPP